MRLIKLGQNNLIIKYTILKNGNVEVIYADGKKDIITHNQFEKYQKDNLVRMAFIIPN